MLRTRPTFVFAALFLLACLPAFAPAQFAGSRGGTETKTGVTELPRLSRDVVEGYITIEGRAELRAHPTAIRAVMAVTAEAETAQACQKSVDATVERVTGAWKTLGIAPEKMHVDFIAVLPRYEWEIERRGNIEVGIEKKAGYRMQSNLHLAVETEARAQEAFTAAFEEGVTDIIAFDYLSDELDAIKIKAREQAVAAARAKADMLLSLLPDRPRLINLQEQSEVHYPQSLYRSFSNSYEENVTTTYRRDIPFVHAFRPKNTYYRGLNSESDVQPRELPMQPEISVVSTVRLYFESPAAEAGKEPGKGKKAGKRKKARRG